jgi:serine/threonine protein kinase
MTADPAAAKALFLEAAALDDATARAALLSERCGEDAALLARVNALLAANDRAVANQGTGSFFDPERSGGLEPTLNLSGKDEHIGAVIAGKYKLIEEIGEGGMGSVYMAQQTEPVKRAVAVKVIKAGMDSKAILARFDAERQALAMMDHPNIARVLDAGATESGRPYFVMELVKGVPITEYCDARKLTPRQRLELFVPVCQAIQHAHMKGIIHRDIKPSNVLVALYDDRPVPKVIDFGVAKAAGQPLTDRTLMTGYGAVVGTPEYMSPEQASFNQVDVDTRSDVYALGVLLYELLTGSTPIDRKSLGKAALMEVLRIVREVEAPRPSAKLSTLNTLPSVAANRGTEPAKLSKLFRGELDWVLLKALEKDRTRRYDTANGFAADVQRYLAGEAVLAVPPSRAYRLKKFVRRNKGQVIAASLVFFVLAAGMFGTTWGFVRARKQQTVAHWERDSAEQSKMEARDESRKAYAARVEAEKAKTAESNRAEGERQAKQQALAEADKAKASAAESRAVLDFFLNQVLAAARPKKLAGGLGVDTTVRAAVDAAESRITESFKHQPLVEAAVRDSLGTTYSFLGEYELSLRQNTRALALRQEKLGPDHPDTLNSMTSLATSYMVTGQSEKSIVMLEQIVRTRQAKLGPDHIDTLMSTHLLANAYLTIRKFDKALPLLEQLVQKRLAKSGPDHPDTLASMNMLAAAYLSAGKMDKAVPLYEQTLQKMQAKLGPDHPTTLMTMNSLAAVYLMSSRTSQGLRLGEESLQLTRAKLGPDDPNILNSIEMLAMAYFAAGEFQKGLPLCEEALKLTTAKFGPDHPDTLSKIDELAIAYQDAGKLDLALPLFERAAVGVEKRQFKPVRTPQVISSTIRAYEGAAQHDKAEAWRRKWLAVVKERSGADSLPYASELASLGSNLLQQKKWTEAETVLRQCLTIREKRQPDVWNTFNTQSMLGEALLGQQKYADAELFLLKGYSGLKQREKTIPPQGNTRLPEALDRLIDLAAATNKPDEAKKWRAERAKYPAEEAPLPREKQ